MNSSKRIGYFPEFLHFNPLFHKLNPFICNYRFSVFIVQGEGNTRILKFIASLFLVSRNRVDVLLSSVVPSYLFCFAGSLITSNETGRCATLIFRSTIYCPPRT